MNYEQKYNAALERARKVLRECNSPNCGEKERSIAMDIATYIFPELKESEDEEEKIRKGLKQGFSQYGNSFTTFGGIKVEDIIAWLEKQDDNGNQNWKPSKGQINALEHFVRSIGESSYASPYDDNTKLLKSLMNDLYKLERQGGINKLSEEEQNRFAKGVLSSCAMSFIDYLDAHRYKGKMCVSNGECEDIENAFRNAMWDRLHRYYCKYIEKQGEQNLTDKIEPKFHPGDIVQYITDSTDRRKIEEIDTFCNMYHTDSSPIMFEVEDEWKVVVNAEDVESESANNVEPKFHPGDWIVDKSGLTQQVFDFRGGIYTCTYNSFTTDCESNYHLWAFNDAKDGDVLVCNINKAEIGGDVEKLPNITPTICIYQNVVKDQDFIHTYCSLYNRSSLRLQNAMYYNMFVYNIHPATEEQRDFLFSKMKEECYEWDAEKKELKKIESKKLDADKVIEWIYKY